VGIAYVSRWYDSAHQGTALGVFGMGNVGAAVTNFGAPFLLVAYGWENVAKIYAVILLTMAFIFWFSTEEDPSTKARKASGEKVRPTLMQLEPLKHLRVWRFATYYFFVFGRVQRLNTFRKLKLWTASILQVTWLALNKNKQYVHHIGPSRYLKRCDLMSPSISVLQPIIQIESHLALNFV
jgi:nitrate/nitrite transporter NarK